jgi:hypothetical protein
MRGHSPTFLLFLRKHRAILLHAQTKEGFSFIIIIPLHFKFEVYLNHVLLIIFMKFIHHNSS